MDNQIRWVAGERVCAKGVGLSRCLRQTLRLGPPCKNHQPNVFISLFNLKVKLQKWVNKTISWALPEEVLNPWYLSWSSKSNCKLQKCCHQKEKKRGNLVNDGGGRQKVIQSSPESLYQVGFMWTFCWARKDFQMNVILADLAQDQKQSTFTLSLLSLGSSWHFDSPDF